MRPLTRVFLILLGVLVLLLAVSLTVMPDILPLAVFLGIGCVALLIVLLATRKNHKKEPKPEPINGLTPACAKKVQLIKQNRCPFCSTDLREGGDVYTREFSCPKCNLSFKRTIGFSSDYHDETVAEKHFFERYSYSDFYWYNQYMEDGTRFGIVSPQENKLLTEAFDYLGRVVRVIPIDNPEQFAAEIYDGKALINNICPLCGQTVAHYTVQVKGSGETVTTLKHTGYGEWTVNREYRGTYDHVVKSHQCASGHLYNVT